MSNHTVVLKFEQFLQQNVGEINKFIGLVRASNLIDLIHAIDLEANPRSSKTGAVTEAILDSIDKTPEIFPLKTKGILLGASTYSMLERNRVRIEFTDTSLEGILDGGHNTLAIGMYVLSLVLPDDREISRIKTWEEFRKAWNKHKGEIEALRQSRRATGHNGSTELDFLVPIELIVPRDPEDPRSMEFFNESLLDICAARNNNVQLRTEAKANQSGYFDYFRAVLPESISRNVEWKTNEGGPVKAADLIALTWIPLSLLEPLPEDDTGKSVSAPVPQNIYRSKGDCLTRFERLMSSKSVTHESNGRSELVNARIKSALDIAKDLPEIFEYIYANLPAVYNSQVKGKFRGIKAVQKMNPDGSRAPKVSKFTREPVDDNIPEGFVVPLVWGLRGLMRRTEGGQIVWQTDPHDFLKEHFPEIVKQVAMLMQPLDFDPQKFGKEPVTYQLAETAVRSILIQQGAKVS